jgi:cytoskeleton protein RodZ
VVLLLASLWLLGSWPLGDDEEPASPDRVGETEPTATPDAGGDEPDQPRERRPRRVRLQLVATAPVYVCVVDAGGRQVIDEETLAPDTVTRVLRSRRFLTNFGNNGIRMRVNGRTYPVAESTGAIGYELRPGRRPRRLSDERRPDCSS